MEALIKTSTFFYFVRNNKNKLYSMIDTICIIIYYYILYINMSVYSS